MRSATQPFDDGPSVRYERAPNARVLEHDGRVSVVGHDGAARTFEPDATPLARAVLDLLTVPLSYPALRAQIEALADGPLDDDAVLRELLAVLLEARAVARHREAPASEGPRGATATARPRVVLGITGAVAAMHSPALVALLLAEGFDVWPALTRDARRFVSAQALAALTHRPVHSTLWSGGVSAPAPHLELARWADLVLVCPASATTLARLAQGAFDDLVAAVAGCTPAPVLVVPSMNPLMYAAPAVRRNLALLSDDGRYVALPGRGVEVADAPAARAPVWGPAPPWPDVVALAKATLALHRRATSATHDEPAPAATTSATHDEPARWGALYAHDDPRQRPWDNAAAEPTALRWLCAHAAPPGPVLDAGCGRGALAEALVRAGYEVVGVDLSERALDDATERCARARREGAAGRFEPVVGDVRTSALAAGRFAAAHDRGCLHTLPREAHAGYLARLAGLVREGGVVVLTVHADEDPRTRSFATHGYTEAALRALVAAVPALALEELAAVPFAGPGFDGSDGAQPLRAHCARARVRGGAR